MEDYHISIACEKCKNEAVDIWVTNPDSYKKTNIVLSCISCSHKTNSTVVGDFSIGQLEDMSEVEDMEYEDGTVLIKVKNE